MSEHRPLIRFAAFPRQPAGQSEYRARYKSSEWREFFYYHLSVIDSKAGTLLRYNGIMIAVLSLMAMQFRPPEQPMGLMGFDVPLALFVWALIAALTLFFVSTLFAMSVAPLFWFKGGELKGLGGGVQAGGAAQTTDGDESHVPAGFRLIQSRTQRYNLAFLMAFSGTAPLIVAAALFILHSSPLQAYLN